jgi:hypothetical protein
VELINGWVRVILMDTMLEKFLPHHVNFDEFALYQDLRKLLLFPNWSHDVSPCDEV